MASPCVHSVLIAILNILVAFAIPAQKFSPGVVITPTVNQDSPGKVTGLIHESSDSIKSVSPETGSALVQKVASQPTQAQIYERPATQYLSDSSQYVAPAAPVVYAQPNENRFVQPTSAPIATRNGALNSNPSTNYYQPPSNYYQSSQPKVVYAMPASNYYSSSPSLNSMTNSDTTNSQKSSALRGVTRVATYGALGVGASALGTGAVGAGVLGAGILGAGALGAGLLLLG